MVETREKIGRIVAARDESGLNERPAEAYRRQSVVDTRDVCGRNRDDVRVVAARLLDVAEEEGAAFEDRRAEASAVLPLRQRVFRRRKRITSVEALVSEEAVKFAVNVVGSALRHDVDEAG